MIVSVTVNVQDEGKPHYSSTTVVSEAALNAVWFDFNPSSNASVTDIKALCAALIEEMRSIQETNGVRPAQARTAAIAITDIEKVQMVAVKALFAK